VLLVAESIEDRVAGMEVAGLDGGFAKVAAADGGVFPAGGVLQPRADRGLQAARDVATTTTAHGRVERGRDVEVPTGDRGVLRAAALAGDAFGERQGFTGSRGEIVTAARDRGVEVVGEVERAAGDNRGYVLRVASARVGVLYKGLGRGASVLRVRGRQSQSTTSSRSGFAEGPYSKPRIARASRASASRMRVRALVACAPDSIREIAEAVVCIRLASCC
jgi:hypothetical protein